MRRSAVRWKWLAIVLAAGITSLLAPPVSAQERVTVRDLRRLFDGGYKNELVEVHGWVSSERRVTSKTYKGFYLKDRYGDFLLVRTTQPLPDINTELDVKGVAVRDADTRDVYLTETARTPAGASVVQREQERQKAEQERLEELRRQEAERHRQEEEAAAATRRLLIGIGVAVAALVGLAGYLLLRRRPAGIAAGQQPEWDSLGAESPQPNSADNAGAESSSGMTMEDLKTVKVYKTTKVLPGQLVVVENRQETETILLTDQSGHGEIEIGRDSPEVTGGIRIKDPTNTLSRRQARITYATAGRQFGLTNLAGDASNPTILNGRQMREGESATLKDGDLFVMGSVEMKFRQK